MYLIFTTRARLTCKHSIRKHATNAARASEKVNRNPTSPDEREKPPTGGLCVYAVNIDAETPARGIGKRAYYTGRLHDYRWRFSLSICRLRPKVQPPGGGGRWEKESRFGVRGTCTRTHYCVRRFFLSKTDREHARDLRPKLVCFFRFRFAVGSKRGNKCQICLRDPCVVNSDGEPSKHSDFTKTCSVKTTNCRDKGLRTLNATTRYARLSER